MVDLESALDEVRRFGTRPPAPRPPLERLDELVRGRRRRRRATRGASAFVVLLIGAAGLNIAASDNDPADVRAVDDTGQSSSSTSAASPALSDTSPERYVEPEEAAGLGAIPGPVLLPTWLPSWTAEAQYQVMLPPGTDTYIASWTIDYGDHPLTLELDSELSIQLWSNVIDDEDPPLRPSKTSGVRAYEVGDSYGRGDCGGPEGPDNIGVVWDEGGRRFTVLMTPSPGCANGFRMEEAIAFADSVVECAPVSAGLRCEESADDNVSETDVGLITDLWEHLERSSEGGLDSWGEAVVDSQYPGFGATFDACTHGVTSPEDFRVAYQIEPSSITSEPDWTVPDFNRPARWWERHLSVAPTL